MKLFRDTITIVCIIASFVADAGELPTDKAKCAANQPIAVELQPLQGTWEGSLMSDTAHRKVTVTITGNSLHFFRDTNFWFETTITLPGGKDPKQLQATIKESSVKGHNGDVVRAFFKIEDGTLTLATMGEDTEETPKGFEASVVDRYELRKVQPQKKMSGSGLSSLVLEGPELHASLKTRELDAVRHVPRAVVPANPHHSTDAAFVEAIARSGSQGSLGREGIRSALYALYREENELGFYGLEAVSAADADRWEEALRKTWAHMGRLARAQVHRKGLVLVVVWTDGVSPECWTAVNASIVERLSAP